MTYLAFCPGPDGGILMLGVMLLLGLAACGVGAVFALILLVRRAEARRGNLAAEMFARP